jgi:ACT domain-containing protein
MRFFTNYQFKTIMRAHTDAQADHAALKAQLAEMHGRISQTLDLVDKTLEQVDQLHQRMSFNNRPKP